MTNVYLRRRWLGDDDDGDGLGTTTTAIGDDGVETAASR
jgi:hypothetical protein